MIQQQPATQWFGIIILRTLEDDELLSWYRLKIQPHNSRISQFPHSFYIILQYFKIK